MTKTTLMKFVRRLIAPVVPVVPVVNEDDGYHDHLVGQTCGPFYCGTAFCGHSTKKAARECWRKKREAIDAICATATALRESGKSKEADQAEEKIAAYYPERNPANWPINRSSADMRAEYVARAKAEAANDSP